MTSQAQTVPTGRDSTGLTASCESWIPLITEHMPSRFAGAEPLARLASRLAFLPATGLIALELHLARQNPQIDLSQRFDEPESAQAFAERVGADDLGSLLNPWARGDLEELDNIWFEMDILPTAHAGPRPAVISCAAFNLEADPEWITDRLAPCFRAGGLTPQQRRTLLEALGHLRDVGGRPIYLFDLEPRGAGLVRLDTIGLDQPARVEFLSRFAPAATVGQIKDLPAWTNDLGRHHLSFDVHPDGRIGDRLGTELSNVKLPHRDPRWGRLFDNLVAEGLCDPQSREAVESWTGKDDRHTAASAWPQAPGLSNGCCVRCISHVKLVTWPDRPVEAKVYLLLQYLDRETLEQNRRARLAN